MKIQWSKLNALQAAQLQDSIKAGCTILSAANKNGKKPNSTAPLFKPDETKQQKLF
jgi:hypothetical protein